MLESGSLWSLFFPAPWLLVRLRLVPYGYSGLPALALILLLLAVLLLPFPAGLVFALLVLDLLHLQVALCDVLREAG